MYAIRYNSSEYTPHLSDQQRFDHPFLCDAPEGKKEKLAWKFELLRKTKSTNGHKKKKLIKWKKTADTHSVSDCFSVKTLRTKSASRLGSKVEGTMRYSPGGRRTRVLTSRMLMKVSERAHDWLLKKKLFFKWTFWQPLYWGQQGESTQVKMHLHFERVISLTPVHFTSWEWLCKGGLLN